MSEMSSTAAVARGLVTDERLARYAEIAKAATGAGDDWYGDGQGSVIIPDAEHDGDSWTDLSTVIATDLRPEDEAFVATFNPRVVAALLGEIHRLRRAAGEVPLS